VKVVSSTNISGGLKIPVTKKKLGLICASALGFKVFKKYPEHPYLHNDISSELQSYEFVDPYLNGYETEIVKLTHPELL